MRQVIRFLGEVLILAILSSCQYQSTTPNRTDTPLAILSTSAQPLVSATSSPSEIPSPTTTIPIETATPRPFLPINLQPITSGNIGGLKLIASLPVKGIYFAAFSPSGRYLATISERWQDRSKFLCVWNLEIGKLLLSVDKVDSPSRAAFDVTETQLYVFYRSRGFDIYDLENSKLIRTIDVKADDAVFSPDGKYLAIGKMDDTRDMISLIIQDSTTGVEYLNRTIPGTIPHLDFSPDSKSLISGTQVGNHYRSDVWAIASGESIHEMLDMDGFVFSPDNTLAAAVKGPQLYIQDTASWKLLKILQFSDPYDPVGLECFSKNNEILVVEDKYDIKFIKITTLEQIYLLPAECKARFSPADTFLITWCYQNNLEFWGLAE